MTTSDVQRTDDDDEPPPGKLRWLVSCDESGTHGARYYGFGTLWMKWQRRGDFARDFRDFCAKHRFHDECKWNKTQSRKDPSFFIALIDYFFSRAWLAFHCLIVRRALVDRARHDGDFDLARRKHFTLLLTNKIKRALNARKDREQEFRIWVDPIASRYKKADEAVNVIANNVLAQVFGTLRPVDAVVTKDSRITPQIQFCDLLLGAVMEAWQQAARAPSKQAIQARIAHHLGWEDLRADTHPGERKFNVWYFHDPTLGPREIGSRRVVLRLPLSEQALWGPDDIEGPDRQRGR